MKCPKCNAFSPDEKRYCADCGTDLKAITEISPAYIDDRIRCAIKDQLADQKVVEVELTEAILQRITAWGKLLGFFAGIPVAIMVVVLGALGIKEYLDVRALIGDAEKAIDPIVERALQQAKNNDKEATELANRLEATKQTLADLDKDMAKTQAIVGGIPSLTAKVNSITIDVEHLKQDRPSAIRPNIKYREPDKRTPPKIVTVDELFSWPLPGVNERIAEFHDSAIDPRENTVLKITGDLYAAEVDGTTRSIRVLISQPGRSPERTVILAVPDGDVAAKAGVKDKTSYATTQIDLLKILGRKRDKLVKGPDWEVLKNFPRPRRITATGYAQYNSAYADRLAGGAKIGVWQVSPVWQIQK